MMKNSLMIKNIKVSNEIKVYELSIVLYFLLIVLDVTVQAIVLLSILVVSE